MDHSSHTSHTEWVRAAVRDYLGLADEGGTVHFDADTLRGVAEEARKATLNWVVAAAQNGHIPHAHSKESSYGNDSGDTTRLGDPRPSDPA